MRIGIPREIKDGEHRVALTPTAVRQLTHVVVEPGAGAGVGFTDAQYLAAGATLGDAWECELVVKVKELQEPEYLPSLLRGKLFESVNKLPCLQVGILYRLVEGLSPRALKAPAFRKP